MFPRVMMMLNVVYFVVPMILNKLLEKKDIGVLENDMREYSLFFFFFINREAKGGDK